MTPEFLEAVLDGDRDRASEALDIQLPDDFPAEGIMRFFALRLSQMRRDGNLSERRQPCACAHNAQRLSAPSVIGAQHDDARRYLQS